MSKNGQYSIGIGDFNSVYNFLDNNPEVLLPVSAFASGFIAGGLPAACVGAGLVVLEQGYNYYTGQNSTLVSTSFLTYSVFGSALTGYLFGGKEVILPAASVISGYFLDQGYLEKHSEVVDHLSTSLMGHYLCGPWCAPLGFVASVADSYIQDYYQTEKRFLTTAITISTMVKYPSSFIAVKYGAIYQNAIFASVPLLAIAHEEYEMRIVNVEYSKQVDRYYQVKNTFAEILGKEKAEQHLYNHIVINSGLNIAKMHFFNNVMKSFSHIRNSINPKTIDGKAFSKALKEFTSALTPFLAVVPLADYIGSFFVNKAYIDIRQKKQDMFLSGSMPIAIENNGLINHTEVHSLGENFNQNSWLLCQNGINENINIVSNFQEFVFSSVKMHVQGFSDVLVGSFTAYSISNYVTRILGELKGAYTVQLKDLTFREDTLSKQVVQNARQIVETGGADFTKRQLNDVSYEKLNTEIKKNDISKWLNFWLELKGWGVFVSSYYISAKLLFSGEVGAENIASTSYNAANIKIFSWDAARSSENRDLNNAMESIQKFMRLLSNATDNIADSGIYREFEPSIDSMLINLKVTLAEGGQKIVDFDQVSFDVGKIYSFTGASGSGKSSSISKIMGIDGNGISAEGVIRYPFSDMSQILYVPQKDYIPLYVDLCQAILYPEKKEEDGCNGKEVEILKLLNILRFNSDQDQPYIDEDLYKEKEWNKILSGGQLKKVVLIRALIKEYNLLILDEIFNGMDPDSIEIAQQLISDFTGDKITIIVDHNADSNNKSGFYTGGNLHISNKVASIYGDEEGDICSVSSDIDIFTGEGNEFDACFE